MKDINLDKLAKVLKTLSPKRKAVLRSMSTDIQLCYLTSFISKPEKPLEGCRIPIKEFENTLKMHMPLGTCSEFRGKSDMQTRFKKLKKERLKTDTFKKPYLPTGDWIGVEIECFLKREDFNSRSDCECYASNDCDSCDYGDNIACSDHCECRSSNHIGNVGARLRQAKVLNVQVVSDGSLQPMDGYFGVEIKVLFRLSDTSSLEKVCKFLKRYEAKVNTTCGLHVHLDVSRFENKEAKLRFVNNLVHSLPYLTQMTPKSRRQNNYCRYGTSPTDRYYMINQTSMSKHNTIEVRMHSGTTNWNKIINWVTLLTKIKQESKLEVKKSFTSIDSWFAFFGIDSKLKAWCNKRIEEFSVETREESESEAA